MGDSQARERHEGRSGPPTWRELFAASAKASYRVAAEKLLRDLELTPRDDIFARRKIAEAKREHDSHVRLREALPGLRAIDRLILDTEAGLTQLVRLYAGPAPAELVAARDHLQRSAQGIPRSRKGPEGRPKMPYAAKAIADLRPRLFDSADVRVLLRAAGIPLPTGRPPTAPRH